MRNTHTHIVYLQNNN